MTVANSTINGQVGIWNEGGTLTVSNCTVSSNSGVGLFNNGSSAIASLTITNSLFSNNGLSIINQSEGPTRTMASGSTLIRKPAGDGSGAGNCTACMTIANSVVAGNTTGIFNVAYAPHAATVTVLNSRFTDNLGGIGTYGFGGDAELTVTNSTISGNFLYGGIDSGFSSVSIANSTFSDNHW